MGHSISTNEGAGMTSFVRFYWLDPSRNQDAVVDVNSKYIKALSLNLPDERALALNMVDATVISVLPVEANGTILHGASGEHPQTLLSNAVEYIRRAEQR